jgi:hypothetical protein
MQWDEWPTLDVVNAPASVRIIGTAYAKGWVQHWGGPVTTYRLVVNKTAVPGLWVCMGGRFVPLDEAAVEL